MLKLQGTAMIVVDKILTCRENWKSRETGKSWNLIWSGKVRGKQNSY